MVTIKHIAARLSVSASTVGRALADDPRISGAMKQRVQEVADELGYVPNRAARMMRGVSSNLVGLVLPDIRNTFYSTIAHSLSQCLGRDGFQLALSETDDDRTVELRQVRELVSANVAGMILVPTARPHPDTVRLLKTTPHIQLLRMHRALGQQWFGVDDRQALFLATRHLVEHGHRRIAYIGGSLELSTGAARLKGYRDALAGVAARDKTLEIVGAPAAPDFGRDALRSLLASANPPTGLVLGTVQHTQSVLDEILARGIAVPDELSIVGFGDEPGFRWWGAGLTTLAMPTSELATACGLWFLHQMKQRPAAMIPYSSVSPPKLIVRGSTGAPASRAKRATAKAPRQVDRRVTQD